MDPGTGRFLTRDTWAGDYDDPMSLNKWMYVMGNPVMYTDPSGHSSSECDFIADANEREECESNYQRDLALKDRYKNPEKYDPKTPLLGVKWNPSISAKLASSIQQGNYEAQYGPFLTGDEEIPADAWGPNLCGFVVASMILETDNSALMYTLKNIWGASGNTTDTYSGATIFRAFMGAYGWTANWKADFHHGGTTEHYDNKGNPMGRGVLRDWNGNIKDHLKSMLVKGHYPIILSNIDPNTGWQIPYNTEKTNYGHWVLVTGFSSSEVYSPYKWVRINNPFNNQEEFYPWWYFDKTLTPGDHVVEIWKE